MTRWSDEEMDAFDRDVLRVDDAPRPSPRFVAELRMSLRHEARRLESTAAQPSEGTRLTQWPITTLAPALPRPAVRFRGVSPWLNHAASIGLVAALLLVSVTLLNDRLTPEPRPTINAGFAVATPSAVSRKYASVPMPGGNPARTNVQPGPGLSTVPKIARHGNTAGDSMVLADGVLIVTSSNRVTALDAATLQELWSAEPTRFGNASPPVVADGRIVFTTALNTETSGGEARYFPLVALSAEDGRELWRVDGGGASPASPIVDGETVYSLGVADGWFQVGAYRVDDGQAIWQTDVGPFAWCCPTVGIALGNGLLAVSDARSLVVYDAATGARRWSYTPASGEQVGTPVIAGDMVVVNVALEPARDVYQEPEASSTIAFDLTTGDVRWRNDSTRSYWGSLSAGSSGILYAGPWEGEENGQLALLSLESGEPLWTVPLPRVEGDVQTYIGPPGGVAPVIVDDTAYVVVGSVPFGGSPIPSNLIAAVDLTTGASRWMAQIDGNVVGTPIVSGGHIFALTHDAGLAVLEGSGQAPAAGTTVDLRTPVLCNALPSESPMLGDLPATPSIPGVAEWKVPVLFSQISSGQPSNVDPSIAAQLEQRFKEYRSCSATDPYGSVFGFFSTDFYVRLKPLGVGVYNSDAQPWAVWMAHMGEYLYLDVGSLQMLPDGRIGGMVNSPLQNIYTWWVQEDGVWKIDEYHRVEADSVDPNAATPTPSVNAEGTPFD